MRLQQLLHYKTAKISINKLVKIYRYSWILFLILRLYSEYRRGSRHLRSVRGWSSGRWSVAYVNRCAAFVLIVRCASVLQAAAGANGAAAAS